MRKLFNNRCELADHFFKLFLVVSIVGLIFVGQIKTPFAAEPPPVKKSRSSICHCPGGAYYGRTKHFTPYCSIEKCLDSGGRPPNRGQGDCTMATCPEDKPQSPKLGIRIIDGDTIHLGKVRVRLHGIDAPETHQTCRNAKGETYPCGKRATSVLVLRAAAGVNCEPAGDEQDRYGRMIATCYAVDGTNINAYMVRSGHALAYRKYSQKYVPEEGRARAGRRGMHRGAFVAPWDWRRGKRLQ